jgi:competence protein ComEA
VLPVNWRDHQQTAVLAAVALATLVMLLRLYPRAQTMPSVPPTPASQPAAAAAPATPAPVSSPTPQVRPTPAPVDLNRATKAELLALPGIGEVRAGRIIESRQQDGPFRDPDELVSRRIVPRAVFDLIKDRLTVR